MKIKACIANTTFADRLRQMLHPKGNIRVKLAAMGNIIGRKKAIQVEARRAEVQPEIINIPGAGPLRMPSQPQGSAQAAPQQSPGVTQNIIYVNVQQPVANAPAPVSPPADQSPREIHHHHTTVYQAPKRRRLGRGTSFLGTLGFVLGGLAFGAARVPQLLPFSKYIAEIGLGAAAVGLLGAMLFGRVGRFMPLLGMIASAAGYCAFLYGDGQLAAKYNDLRSKSPVELPKLNLDNPAPPALVTPSPRQTNAPAVSVPAPTSIDPTRLHDKSIFGDGSPGWVKPAPSPAVSDSPAVASPAAVMDLATASVNVESARIAAAKRMGLDYEATKAALNEANSRYQDARISGGNAELVAAGQQRLQAESKYNLLVAKLRSDAEVIAAEKMLTAAGKK